jgi:hypothetical protein
MQSSAVPALGNISGFKNALNKPPDITTNIGRTSLRSTLEDIQDHLNALQGEIPGQANFNIARRNALSYAKTALDRLKDYGKPLGGKQMGRSPVYRFYLSKDLTDLSNELDKLGQKSTELRSDDGEDLKTDYIRRNLVPLAAHEAGHAVLANHLGAPVDRIEMFPRPQRGDARVMFKNFNENVPDVANRNIIRMGGNAGEARLGRDAQLRSFADRVDRKAIEEDSKILGTNPDMDTGRALNAARRLLEGELADQHMELTRFLVQNYGKALSFSEFKHILQPLHVSPKHFAKLYQNYQTQSQEANA